MGGKTQIEWTDTTWNPVTGCSHVSDGCTHCYAERLSARFGWTTQPWGAQHAAENVVLHHNRINQPYGWKRPRRIFVCSMADLFHELVPEEFIHAVWTVMRNTPQHTYQVLTKRPGRMLDIVQHLSWMTHPYDRGGFVAYRGQPGSHVLPNVWLGVSCEDQRRADERIPILLQTPAAVRFLSCEPLLGPLVLTRVAAVMGYGEAWTNTLTGKRTSISPGGIAVRDAGHIDWVIVGGESGGPPDRRLVERCDHSVVDPDRSSWLCPACRDTGWRPKPEVLAWVRSIRNQCQAVGVAFFLKGWGGLTPRSGGALLDGREWREHPAELAGGRGVKCRVCANCRRTDSPQWITGYDATGRRLVCCCMECYQAAKMCEPKRREVAQQMVMEI